MRAPWAVLISLLAVLPAHGQLDSTQTVSALSFLNSIGVNTHMGYTGETYVDAAQVLSAMSYLGVRHARDGSDASTNKYYQPLAQAGITLTLVSAVGGALSTTTVLDTYDVFVASYPGTLKAIEGPNEINNWPVTYAMQTGTQSAVDFMTDLSAGIRADPNLSGVMIYNFTNQGGSTSYPSVPMSSTLADAANVHPYPQDGAQPIPWYQGAFDVAYGTHVPVSNGVPFPMVATEDGYYSLSPGADDTPTYNSVNEDVKAKLTLNIILDAKYYGLSEIDLYELVDEGHEPGGYWGLFSYGGTWPNFTFYPKEAALVIHNMTMILADTAAVVSPAPLSYSVSTPAYSFPIEKSNGAYDIALWSEQHQLWSPANSGGTQRTVPISTITVTLATAHPWAVLYDPLQGVAPVGIWSDVSQVPVPLSDHAVFLELPISVSSASAPIAAAYGVGAGSITANWSANGNPASTVYQVQLSTSSGFTVAVASQQTTGPSATFLPLNANTTYYGQVEAFNTAAGTWTPYVSLGSTCTPVAAPIKASPTNVTSTAVTANWSADGNSPTTVYAARISTNNFTTFNATVQVSTVDAAFSGLSPNTTYYFRVAAIANNGAETAFTSLASTMTLAADPSSIFATYAGTSSAALSWSGGGNPSGTQYAAQISTDGGFSSLTASSVAFSTGAAFLGLSPNTTYFFQVAAIGRDGIETAFSSAGSTITPAAAPSAAVATDAGAGSIALSWTGDGNPSGTRYTAQLSTNAGFSPIAASSVAFSTSVVFLGLVPNTTYFLRVDAVNAAGLATAYAVAPATTTPAAAPASPFATYASTSSVALSWSANGDPPGTQYAVQLSTNIGFSPVAASTLTFSTSSVFLGLSPNETYFFQVAAISADESFSSPGSTITPAAAPSSAAAANASTSSVALSWSGGGNPPGTQYTVQLSTDMGFSPVAASSVTFAASAAFLGLAPNTTYFLRVDAVNAAGLATAYAVAAATSTPAAAPTPGAPTIATSNSAASNWGANGNPGSTAYVAQISTDGFTTVNASSRTNATTAVFSGLTANTAYFFRVAALGNGGSETAFTLLPSTTTLLLPPAAAANAYLDVGYTSAAVRWASGGNGPGTTYVAQISTSSSLTPVSFSSTTLNLSAVFGAGGAGPNLSPNTTYYFLVFAATGANSSPFTALGSTATAAYAPSGTSVVSVTSTTALVAWQANGDPSGTSYELWRSLTSAFSSPIKTRLSTTSFLASSLAADTTYFFQVRALGNDGVYTAFDLPLSTATSPPAPGAPGTPFGAALGVSSISWNWTAARYASSYRVFRASADAVFASTPTLAFIDAGLSTNTAYGLLVQGIDATGLGALSAPATFYTLAAVPAGGVVSAVAATSATLTWSANTNPPGTGAEVQRSTDGFAFVSLVSSDTALAFVDYGLLGCTTYYYRVRNANGDGIATSFDAVGPFVTSNTVPAPASKFSARALGGDSVALSWAPSPTEGIAGYRLFYDAGTGTVDYASPLASLPGSATSYIEVLPSSAAYIFALRARQRCGVEETAGVFATAASISSSALNAVRADIVSPGAGRSVYGTGLTVYAALVAGTPAETEQILFQYRPHGTTAWSAMTAASVNQPNPAANAPYFIHWDVTALAPGSYDLSAVAVGVSGSSDSAPDSITVVVDSSTPDLLESVAGGLRQTFFTAIANTFNSGSAGTAGPLASITIPGGLVEGSTASVTIVTQGTPPPTPVPAGFTLAPGLLLSATLSNGQSFLNGGTASVSFFSPTSPGPNPTIFSYSTTTEVWAQDVATTYTPADGQIKGLTPHFTVFAVLTGGAPAADLSSVRVYPIPYRPNGGNPDQGGGNTGIVFDQLPASAAIKIYTESGRLVTSFDASAPTGKVVWNAQNDGGRDVASGLYLAVITSPGIKSVTKKILVVR